MEKLVSVNNRKCQCTITIPIAIARKIGINKAAFAMVKIIGGQKLEVSKIDITKENA